MLRAPALACLLLLAAACGAGPGGTSPTPDFAELAREAARSSLLALADLPSGWSQDNGPSPAAPLDLELSSQCDLLASARAFPDATATAESPRFSGPDDALAESFTAVYRTEGGAEAGLRKLADTVAGCHDELVDAIKAAAERQLDRRGIDLGPFGEVDVSLDEATPPALAGDALAYRVQVRAGVLTVGEEFNLDIVILRSGRLAGAIVYGGGGDIDTASEVRAEQALADHLQKADATLPRSVASP